LNQIHQTKQQAFETKCTAIIDQSDHKYQEKIDAAIQQVDIDIDKRTMQLRLDANDTEHRLNILQDKLADEAQLILNQLPLDMAIIKQELEYELRTYGDLVRQDLPTEHRLHTLGSSLMTDLRRQTEAYKAEINSFTGPSRDYNMIPSEAQHAERTRLKHEIATDLHLRIQAETQDQFRTLQQAMDD
jgi:hypothetical protein